MTLPLLNALAGIMGQTPDLRWDLALNAAEVRLSDSVRVTLTVDGAAPLRVTVPPKVLAGDAEAVWKVRVVAGPTVTDLGNGRQRWTLTLRLDPYLRGDALPVAFAPFEAVTGSDPTPRSITWPRKTVKVWSAASVTDDVRPVTGIEPTPPAAVETVNWTGPILALSAVAAAGLAVGVVRNRRRGRVPPTPFERADRRLAAATDAATVADAVREYVESTFAVPATRLTTPELRMQLNGIPDGAGAALVSLLERCDGAKFARDDLDRAELVEQARSFLVLARPSNGPVT
jgi:hypothetical protein